MVHLFFPDVFVAHKQERLLAEAARERQIRELKRWRQREDGSECAEGLRQAFAGVIYRVLVSGPGMMVTEMFYRKHANTPVHSHPSEQAGYVLCGRLRLMVRGQERVLGTGDAYLIPGSEPHCFHALEEAAVVDVFSPPREEYCESLCR